MTKKKIKILDSLGHKVSGTLSIPKNASLVVIMSHGFTSNRNTKLYIELEKEFNSKGIGTLRYDYYGHGPAYGHNTRGVSSDITITKAAESLRAVIKHLRQKGNYDIGLVGSSFGGLVSLVVASKDSNLKFLVLKSPVTNPKEFWNERVQGPKNKIIKDWKKNDVFHYNRNGEDYILKWIFWKDIQKYDSVKLAKGISCPTFIVHGDKDDIVPIKYNKNFSRIVGIKLNVVKGANHHYSRQKHYLEMKILIKNFILNESKKKNIKAVIFDWNGVITDSLKLDHEIFIKECKREGLKVPSSVNFYSNIFNDNVYVCLENIGFHIDEESEKNYRKLYMKGLWRTKPFPGIKPVLKNLKRNYKLAIITSNYTTAVETFFKNHGIKEFDLILSSDNNRRKENKIKILLKKFSISKREVIFVGDTVSDIKASKAIGIKSIAVTWGYQSRSKLKKHKPDYIADKPTDIIKILEGVDKNVKR